MSLQTTINSAGLPSIVPTNYDPSAAVGTSIPVTTGIINMTNAGAAVMLATPTIATSGIAAGTKVTLVGSGAGTTTLTDDGTLPGSALQLGASTRAIAQYQTIVLVYNGTYWIEESYSAAGGGGGSGIIPFNAGIDDPSAVVILPETGTPGSTTITNTGAAASVTFAAFGTAQISAAQSKWGGGSAAFDGNTSYIAATPASSSLAIGTGDFTYEAWIWLTARASANTLGTPMGSAIWDARDLGGGSGFLVATSNTGLNGIIVWVSGQVIETNTTPISLSTWTHVAFVRSGTTLTVFINGVPQAATASSALNCLSTQLTLGSTSDFRGSAGVLKLNGYMNDFRFSNIARYSTNFAPGPTSAFTPAYNPALLPASPVAGQLAMSSYSLYACTNPVGPVWKRTLLNTP